MSKKPLCSLIKCLREIIGLFDLIAVGNILVSNWNAIAWIIDRLSNLYFSVMKMKTAIVKRAGTILAFQFFMKGELMIQYLKENSRRFTCHRWSVNILLSSCDRCSDRRGRGCAPGGVPARGVGDLPGGCTCPGVYPSMHWGRHPPPPCEQNDLTDACENINLPQLRCGR